MKNRAALLVYPHFSLQEVSTAAAVFRWYGDSPITLFASQTTPVESEEGVLVQPNQTVNEFKAEDFDCLILPGCSDMRESLRDEQLKSFLRGLHGNERLTIGAIGSGPALLAQAGLLDARRYTNSLFIEMNEQFPFIDESQWVPEPLVQDGTIVTAVGEAYQEFAVALAQLVGHNCPESAYDGAATDWTEATLAHHLPPEGLEQFQQEFADLLMQH